MTPGTLTLYNTKDNQPPPEAMALLSMASDLETGETIWVSANVLHGGQQANSHTWKDLGFDGVTAVQMAGIHNNRKSRPCPVSGWRSNQWG